MHIVRTTFKRGLTKACTFLCPLTCTGTSACFRSLPFVNVSVTIDPVNPINLDFNQRYVVTVIYISIG